MKWPGDDSSQQVHCVLSQSLSVRGWKISHKTEPTHQPKGKKVIYIGLIRCFANL